MNRVTIQSVLAEADDLTALHLLILQVELLHGEISDLDSIRTDEHAMFRETGKVSFPLDTTSKNGIKQ